MKLVLVTAVIILSSVAFGATVSGGANANKVCNDAFVDNSFLQKIPDASDCSQYYLCSSWFQSKLRCPDGKHFSAAQGDCTDPCSAGCDPTIICTTTPTPEEFIATAAQVVTKAESVDGTGYVSASDDSAVAGSDGSAAASQSFAVGDIGLKTIANSAKASAVGNTYVKSEAEKPAIETEAAASTKPVTEGVEAKTAFWQAIVKNFASPPTKIPGYTGAIPTNF